MIDVVPNAGVIALGKQGENQAVRVTLPNIRAGAGSILLLHQRSDDQKPYPVPVVEADGGIIWTVSSTDTAYPGRGQAELQWLGADGAVIKSVTYQTNTLRALTAPGAVPDEPLKPYTQAVAKDAQAAKNAAASATEAARTAEASAGQAGLSAATATEAARKAEAIVGQAGQSAQSAQAAALAAAQNASAAETAEDGAKQAQTGAEAASTEAQTAKTAAEKAAQEAKTAQAGAMEAKTGAETAQAKAEEAAQGVAADREQIRANTAGLEAAKQELTATKEQLAETKADLAKAQRAIQFQAELNKGQTWDFETDDQDAYQRQVPSGAKAGAVMEWGGKTVGWNQLCNALPNPGTYKGVNVAVSNGKVSLNGTATDAMLVGVSYAAVTVSGHKYMATGIQGGSKSTFYVQGVNENNGYYDILDSTAIFTATGAKYRYNIIAVAGTVFDHTFQPMVIDITLMFGPENEPADTSDPRIAQIEAYAAAHPEYNAGELVSALVDEVRVANAAGDSTATYPIPAAVKSLPGYGWSAGSVANTVERTDNGWQYVQRVGNVDLGTLDWFDGRTSTSARRMRSRTKPDNVKIPTESSYPPNVICKTYDRVSADETWLCTKEGVSINSGNGTALVYDSRYSTAESLAAFKQHVQGVILYYELSTPITTDITALMGDALAPFAVEAGGSVTLHHPKADEGFALDVPAKIQYITKLSEVSANG
nr:MAG TPA: hypothetical protein [Caudoviricetes sp.]